MKAMTSAQLHIFTYQISLRKYYEEILGKIWQVIGKPYALVDNFYAGEKSHLGIHIFVYLRFHCKLLCILKFPANNARVVVFNALALCPWLAESWDAGFP